MTEFNSGYRCPYGLTTYDAELARRPHSSCRSAYEEIRADCGNDSEPPVVIVSAPLTLAAIVLFYRSFLVRASATLTNQANRLFPLYKCQRCGAQAPRGVHLHRVVVETRPATYPVRGKAHRFRRSGRIKELDDPGGAGVEIARELLVCRECTKAWSAESEPARGPPALAA